MNDFSLIEETVKNIEPLKEEWFTKSKARLDQLTKPLGSLGRLEDVAIRICAILQKEKFQFKHKVIFTLAADHGVTQEGVSAYQSEVTPQMVLNFLRGGAGINVLSRHEGARVVVVDMGVNYPFTPQEGLKIRNIRKGSSNFATGPAMTRQEAILSVEIGIKLVEEELEKGLDLVGTGEMGIGNTTAASAITSVMTGKSAEQVTGLGTGIALEALQNKVNTIQKALAVNTPNPNDAIDVLAKVGGFEIGGLAGVILGAASHKIPVVIDGFISSSAALIANGLSSNARQYMIAGHRSAEPGHDAILHYLGLSPLLDLRMRLGEGTGACLAMHIVEAACKIYMEMATFGEAQVSEKVDMTPVKNEI